MRIKMTPNGDYIVDIDSDLVKQLGLEAGAAVEWSADGKLMARRSCKHTIDGIAEASYDAPSNQYTLRMFNRDQTIATMNMPRETMIAIADIINQTLAAGETNV